MLPTTTCPQGLLVQAESIAQQFEYRAEDVAKATNYFIEQMRSGLKHNGATQIPSFVTNVPNGSEKGLFLAVDLGGTNCRVCSVDLHGDSTYTLVQSKHAIPKDVMVNASYKPLFDFIAQKISDFMNKHPEADIDPKSVALEDTLKSDERRKLGFTFSFTYTNHSLSTGTILQWDKGWDIPEAIGKDPCELLQNSIDSLKLPVVVSALANDSVGTLMARAYTSPWRSTTLAGAIFGTGTNAAYLERLKNIGTSSSQEQLADKGDDGYMIINTEWGAWSDQDVTLLPTTPYDEQIDAESSNPKTQLLEKRVSGLYLGELARLAILHLTQNKLLDMGLERDSPLNTQYGVNSSFLTLVAGEGDQSPDDLSFRISKALKAASVSAEHAQAIRLITKAIVRRAARLAGASLAAIIIQSDRLSKTGMVPKSNKTAFADHQARSLMPRMTSFSKILVRIRRLLRAVLFYLGFLQISMRKTAPKGQESLVAEEDVIDIGIDGLLFEAYPTFENDVREALRDVPQIGLQGEKRIRIGLSKDGSGVGAALVAQSI